MKILLNADTGNVTEKWSPEDKDKTRAERDAERLKILASAVAYSAVATFKSSLSRKMYIEAIAGAALDMIGTDLSIS